MRKIRILNIVPDIYTEGIAVSVKDRQALAAALKEETGGLVELESRIVEGGSESIECFYDSALAAPYILKLVQQGEKDGFDAIVLDCFLDPALSECRELVRIPVMGACQSSCSLAARMAGRFSVIGILDNADRCIRENIRCYCFERQLASIPVIHMPVVELHNMVGGSLILGRAAARHRDGILDSIIRVFSYIGIAVPSFVVAIVLLVIFGNLWQVIPTLGRLSTGVAPPDTITGFYVLDALVQGQFSTAWDAFLHLLLPAFALSLGGMFQDARLMRSALTDNMGKEYMCVSRSYGLPEKVLMNRYLFKPSSTSVITVMGMDIASMVGNAFMVEQVFNWPGFSKYGANAMITKDLNSVCAVVLVIGATFLVVNLIVDVINAMVDPRIRLGGDL